MSLVLSQKSFRETERASPPIATLLNAAAQNFGEYGMKAVWYVRNGTARDVLQVGELPKPLPSPGAVLIRVHTVGLNPSDSKARISAPLPAGTTRMIPHQDGAGIIEEVGEGVPFSRIGERVWIYEAVLSGGAGCAAEYVTVPSINAVKLPNHVSFEEGACLGVPALTAHRCVYADGPVNGLSVLVTGGAGSVGAHAIQFARNGGATVFSTVSNAAQAKIAEGAGASHVIDRTIEDQVLSIRRAAGNTEQRVVDRIVDVAFGANLEVSMMLLRQNGVIATYSSDAKPEPQLPFFPLLRLGANIRFVFVYSMGQEAHNLAIKATTEGLEQGWLSTTIAARFPLEQIIEANEHAESSRSIGKTILSLV